MINSHKYIDGYVEEIGKRIKDTKVLDIGCLATYEKNELKRHKKYKQYTNKIIGIDIKDSIHDYIRDGHDNLLYSDITKSEHVDEIIENFGRFDQIVATDIIEHIDNHRDFLRNCYRLLRPNGLVHITTPNMRSIFWNNKFDINRDHVCWFDIITLETLLNRYDFSVVNYFYSNKKKIGELCKRYNLKLRAEFCRKLYVIGSKINYDQDRNYGRSGIHR